MAQCQTSEVFREVLDSLRTGILVIDRNGKILFWNEGAEHIAGHIPHDVIGRAVREVVLPGCEGHGCGECGSSCPFTRALQQGKPYEARMQIHHKEGHLVPVLLRVAPIRDEHGSVIAMAASFESRRQQADLDREQRRPVPQCCVDEATGVASRGFTEFHLRENLASFTEYQLPFSIICARAEGLDRFRAAYGHEAGDVILRVVAHNLCNNFRPNDFVGRWADDEFVVILMNCGVLGAERVFERISRSMPRASIRWWGEDVSLATAFGFAAVEASDSTHSLVQKAERNLRPEHAAGVRAEQKAGLCS